MAREHDDLVFTDPTPSNERPDTPDEPDDADQTLADTEPTQPEPGPEPAAEPDRNAPDEPDLPADVLAEATQLGIADAVKGLDPENARYHIDLLRSTLGQLALAAQQGGQQPAPADAQDDRSAPPASPPGAPPPRPTPSQAPPAPAGFALQPMDTQDFDPGIQAVAKNVESLHQHYGQQIGQLQNALGQIMQAVQQVTVQAHRNEFDRYVAEASDYADTLGTDASLELDPKSAEYQARMKVAQQMDVLRAGYLATGHPSPSNKTLFLRACAQLFPPAAQQNARKELERRLRDQRGRFAPTPTRTGTNGAGEATGDKAAFDYLRAMHARMTKG